MNQFNPDVEDEYGDPAAYGPEDLPPMIIEAPPPAPIILMAPPDEQTLADALHHDPRFIREGQSRYPHPGPLSREPIYPAHGYPPNKGEDRPGLSPFGRLAKGQPLGKSSLLFYDGGSNAEQPAAVPMLQVEGDDLDATQLLITLAPPRVIALSLAEARAEMVRLGGQNLSGEQTNALVSASDFPGTSSPIQWPPFEAVIEWGVKGASARAQVDFVNGATLSVVASFVRVFGAVTQGPASGDISGTSAVYYLAAFVGPGYTRTGVARKTVYVGTIADSDTSDVFDIPPFASKATVYGSDNDSPPALSAGFLRFWQRPDGANNVGNAYFNGNQPVAFDIPNGAQYFSVFNQSSKAMKLSVVFELNIS